MRQGTRRAAPTRSVLVVAVGIVVTLGIIRLGRATVDGGGPKKSDCYVEFDGVTATKGARVDCMDGDPACDHDGQCDGTCDFQIRLCINQTDIPQCTSPGLSGPPTAKPASVSFPPPGDLLHASCGQFASIEVGTKPAKGKRKAKPKTMKVQVTAKAVSGKPKVDHDTLVLRCLPRTGTCPPQPTTTTTTTSTTLGTCIPTTTTTLPPLTSCGNGTVETGEGCDSGGTLNVQAQCLAGQVCNSSCQCEAGPGCGCGPPDPPKRLSFTTGVGTGNCGMLLDGSDVILPKTCNPGEKMPCTSTADCGPGDYCTDGNNLCGGLYFGGGGVGVPLPSTIPDMGNSLTRITACSGTTLTLGPTNTAETGSIRNCTSKDCFFGPPLPIPNSSQVSTSTCVVNKVSADASGTGDCVAGTASIALPLSSEIFLTADLLDGEAPNRPDVPGIQPCPVCLALTPGAAPTCLGGPNHGLCCQPADSASLGAAYPTSHDCPPPPEDKLGALPIAFNLTTGTQTVHATTLGSHAGQTTVYCPFCSDPLTNLPKNPAKACTADADCAGEVKYTVCSQRGNGAFGHPSAVKISYTGSPSGDMRDRAAHPSTLISIFCIPPTFSALVDGAADLPGPGAVGLQGEAQLLP